MGFFANVQSPIGTIFCVFWHQILMHTIVADSHQRHKVSCISDFTPSTLLGRTGFIHEVFVLQKTSENAVKVTNYTGECDLKYAAACWESKSGISG